MANEFRVKNGIISPNIGTESGDFTIDSAGDIIFDCDDTDIILKDGGTAFGSFKRASSDFIIKAEDADNDIIFKGIDGSSVISALTLDMSEAGAATFSGGIADAGTIAAGTWNGGVIASAYLDADTAHLSGTQTFTGAKSFDENATLAGFVLDGNTITGVDDSGEFTDDDAHIMTSAGINDKFGVIAGSSSIVTVGTIGTGTWQGTAIASAYLDSDTAHLSGTQTFSGNKTFSGSITLGGHAVNDIDVAGEFVDSDEHLMTSAAINDRIAAAGGGASVLGDLTDVTMDITNFVDGILIQPNSDGSAPTTGTLNGATENIGIGKNVFQDLTSADYNVVVGPDAGMNITSGG